ncbi:hypothetical protein BJ875DRAFT_538377 [Amylocarpus encephaloides]|uniref:Uncharacterized protein n=1 Tax=Amylocarpus encephaloides TaxID=45428 RepID=A0A9P7Y690_9HELO|nr:hypothetical protein BJ875DRAFT_538377 [Amylocarpus encephaloides]
MAGRIYERRHRIALSISRILTEAGVEHAFIGGFATKVLGSNRPTADIDVEINVTASNEIIDRIRPLLLQEDYRFSIEHLKLYFTRDDDQRCRISVETLGIGTLGLPCRLSVIHLGATGNIPILHPGVLVLTKIKRYATLSESTRPKSQAKASTDIKDITYLLGWLEEHHEQVNFADYESPQPERLYDTVSQVAFTWRRDSRNELLQLQGSVLKQEDREKVMDT